MANGFLRACRGHLRVGRALCAFFDSVKGAWNPKCRKNIDGLFRWVGGLRRRLWDGNLQLVAEGGLPVSAGHSTPLSMRRSHRPQGAYR
jgi:hypothetical protein